MADQNRTDDHGATQGGIENIINEVETGEEIPGEHPDDVYQFRQRIVSTDNPADVLSGEKEPKESSSPEPLPPAESP